MGISARVDKVKNPCGLKELTPLMFGAYTKAGLRNKPRFLSLF